MSDPLARRLLAEALGTAFLLATVVGSGIMGAKLSGGNIAIALLGNTLPTGAILVVLILIFGPISARCYVRQESSALSAILGDPIPFYEFNSNPIPFQAG